MYHFAMTQSWMERAKTLMQSRGISQEDIAVSLSCTRGAVGHYLSGRRSPSLDQLKQIAEVLHTDPAWLVFGKDHTGVGEASTGYVHTVITVPLTAEIRSHGRRKGGGSLYLPSAATDCYAVLVNINDYEPRIHAGEIVLVDPVTGPAAGDEVLVEYRDRTIGLHTYLKTDGDRVTIDSIVGEKRVRSLAKRDYKLMHKAVAVFRPGMAVWNEGQGVINRCNY